MSFSVLISVYFKEEPNYLDTCLKSLLEQTLQADEVVLVEDGPISVELKNIILKYKEMLNIISVILPENVGLARALNEGLRYCNYELVARMDSDDLSLPTRFEKQVNFMYENLDIAVCGAQIEEWDQKLTKKISFRKVPLNHDDVFRFSKKRSPVSHPVVIFRKSAIVSSGGYPEIYPEDYFLWIKVLYKGYKISNLSDVLLIMRTGDDFIKRRGYGFLKGELKIYLYMYRIGFIALHEYFLSIISRSVLRLSPSFIKKILYKIVR